MNITRNNIPFEVDAVKFCKMLDGTRIYLFNVLKQPIIAGRFIVAVKRGDDVLVFQHHTDIKLAIQHFLDLLCLYA